MTTPMSAPAAPGGLIAGKALGWGDPPCIRRAGEKPIAQMIPPDLVYYRHVQRREPDGGTVTTFAPATPDGEAAVAAAYVEMNRLATLFAAAPELLSAMDAIYRAAENQDMSHLDFRVLTREVARTALALSRGLAGDGGEKP